MLLRTYVDSGVLIWAAQGVTENAEIALRNQIELDFYEASFQANIRCIPTSESLVREAMDHGCHTGISGIDALHIACAVFAGAEEFSTTEKRSKPIHRTKLIKVTCIRPEEDKQ